MLVSGISNPDDKVAVLMQLFFHELGQSTVGQDILPKYCFVKEYTQLSRHGFLKRHCFVS
jgi:hypothetical protein